MSAGLSPESKAIENLRRDLEIAFKDPERALVHYLVSQGFIKASLRDDVLAARSLLTQRDKAGMLVDAIAESVSLKSSLFHKLVADLGQHGAFYHSTVEKLRGEYVRLTSGTQPVGISAPKQQRLQPCELAT